MEETTHSEEEGVTEKHASTERSDTEVDTEAGGEVSTSLLQFKHKKGHITNIYLTDSDKEAIVDFIKDHESSRTRPTNTLRTRPGRNACMRGLPTATSCLARCARLGLNPKEPTMETDPVQVWLGS